MNYAELSNNLISAGATSEEAYYIQLRVAQRALERCGKTGAVVYTAEMQEKYGEQEKAKIWEAVQQAVAQGLSWEQIRDLLI